MSDELQEKKDDVVDTKKVLTDAASKALTPAAEEIGKGLLVVAKCVNLALEPLEGVIWSYAKIKSHIVKSVSEKVSHLSPEKIVTPTAHIAVPVIESLRYTGEIEELRNMFSSLLATSMDKDNKHKAHPAFVEVIKQLSVDEARILAELPSVSEYPFICEAVYEINDIHESYQELYPEFAKVIKGIELENVNSTSTHIGNLLRLGVFEIRRATDSSIEAKDLSYSTRPYDTSASVELSESGYEALYVTDFGKQFISVCINSEFDS